MGLTREKHLELTSVQVFERSTHQLARLINILAIRKHRRPHHSSKFLLKHQTNMMFEGAIPLSHPYDESWVIKLMLLNYEISQVL